MVNLVVISKMLMIDLTSQIKYFFGELSQIQHFTPPILYIFNTMGAFVAQLRNIFSAKSATRSGVGFVGVVL